jgi:hypothetical protein
LPRSQRKRTAAAKRAAAAKRRHAARAQQEAIQAVAAKRTQEAKGHETFVRSHDHNWKVGVAGIGVVGAIAAAHAASVPDIINSFLAEIFGLQPATLDHDSFWQTALLMVIAGLLTIGIIIELRRRA